MDVSTKLACLAFSSMERVYQEVSSDDKTEEIFLLMDNPVKMLRKLDEIGQKYGLNRCNSSFEETGHCYWLAAVQDTKNWARAVYAD